MSIMYYKKQDVINLELSAESSLSSDDKSLLSQLTALGSLTVAEMILDEIDEFDSLDDFNEYLKQLHKEVKLEVLNSDVVHVNFISTGMSNALRHLRNI